jgi:hypothetical protein
MRLFFEEFLIALKQALTDTQTGIPIGMIAQLARLAQDQRGTWSIALNWLADIVAHDQAMAVMTLSTGIARVHTGGDDFMLPCLILAIAEDAALHPVGAFRVATVRILALLRLEITEMFKDENACLMLGGELDNARTHQMGKGLITMAELAPEVGIVLLSFGQDAGLATIDCNTPKLSRALCPLSLCHRR